MAALGFVVGCGGATAPEADVAAVPPSADVPPEPVTARPHASMRPVVRNTTPPEPAAFPMDPVTHVLQLPAPLLYDTGKATLKKQSDASLTFVKQFLDGNPDVTLLRIEGHSDNRGSDKANLKMTGERAVAAARWLIDHGVECSRLIAVGFGETRPIADNNTNDGRVKNRRIDFVEAAYMGRAINGQPVDGGGTVVDLGCP